MSIRAELVVWFGIEVVVRFILSDSAFTRLRTRLNRTSPKRGSHNQYSCEKADIEITCFVDWVGDH